jgi:hypothetical protein
MGRFMQALSHNLSDGLFGIWLIGMGALHGIQPGSPGILTVSNIILGVVLIGAGICSLLGR